MEVVVMPNAEDVDAKRASYLDETSKDRRSVSGSDFKVADATRETGDVSLKR